MGSYQASNDLTGVLVAIATPWKDNTKSIDADQLKFYIDRIVASGCHGIVPGGTTGEFTAMTFDERKRLTELCVEYAAGRVPVVAGVGALSTAECVALAVHAAEAGATATMVVPPFYDPVNYEQLKDMLSEVHSASKLPIVYYHIPGASGLNLTPVQIAGLAEHGVKYLKDTSGNAPALTELLFEHHNKITTFNGWDTLTFYGMAAGAKGSVWGASNVVPELSAELWDAVAIKGDLDLGRKLWAKIFPICKFLESYNYPSAVKTGLELQGIKTGGLRKPFHLLEGEPREELRRLLVDAGLKVVS